MPPDCKASFKCSRLGERKASAAAAVFLWGGDEGRPGLLLVRWNGLLKGVSVDGVLAEDPAGGSSAPNDVSTDGPGIGGKGLLLLVAQAMTVPSPKDAVSNPGRG